MDLDTTPTFEDVFECETKNPESAFYGMTIDELKERIYNGRLKRKTEEDILGHKPTSDKPTLEEEKEAARS